MHICWLAGHLVEEYTPPPRACRGAKDSRSAIRLAPARPRKTAPTAAASRSPSPRTRTTPFSRTVARSASRCATAQPAGSPGVATRRSGGLRGARSTASAELESEDDMSMSFQVVCGRSELREGGGERGGLQHGLRGLGGPGAEEVVAAVGELPQVDLVGEQPPLAVPPGVV